MSKLFVVGAAPLPWEPSKTSYGLGHRTWHFVKPLLVDGHEVMLVAIRIPSAKDAGLDLPEVSTIHQDKMIYHCINEPTTFHDPRFLQKLHDAFQPDCLIGINTYPASVAAQIQSPKPFWADLNGALMTEAQGKAALIKNDSPVQEFWEQELACLHRADVYSTVTLRQKYMLLGELATIGRLNKDTLQYDFAYPIPNSIENLEFKKMKNNLIRGIKVAADDFVVLWSGGYNTWTDIETLFKGLTLAMEKNPKIRFVSTGGTLPSHDETTYQSFLNKINTSPYRDRFFMLGWVPTEDVFEYYFESNLGLNIDNWNYETLTGARNRLIHMMKTGLPVLTSRGTEISETIEQEKIGLTFPIGNSGELANQILFAADNQAMIRSLGQKGKDFVYQHYIYEKTTEMVRKWVQKPWFSPDRGRFSEIPPPPPSNLPRHGQPIQDLLNYFKQFRRNHP